MSINSRFGAGAILHPPAWYGPYVGGLACLFTNDPGVYQMNYSDEELNSMIGKVQNGHTIVSWERAGEGLVKITFKKNE